MKMASYSKAIARIALLAACALMQIGLSVLPAQAQVALEKGKEPVKQAMENARQMAAYPTGKVFKDCPDCPELVVIPAGSYTMGSPPAKSTARTPSGHSIR